MFLEKLKQLSSAGHRSTARKLHSLILTVIVASYHENCAFANTIAADSNSYSPTETEPTPRPKLDSQPPVEISKTFIAFRTAEEAGEIDKILNLYSETCKIALLGPQKTSNFGYPQTVVELSKPEFEELVKSRILNIGGLDLDANGSQNDLATTTTVASKIVYADLRFSPIIPKSPEGTGEVLYEIRGIRKPQYQLNPNASGQFYMEIEKSGGDTKITHHAWEPTPSEELSQENLNKLDNEKLKKAISSVFYQNRENEKTNDGLNENLEVLRVKNVKSLPPVFNFLLKLESNEINDVQNSSQGLKVLEKYIEEPIGKPINETVKENKNIKYDRPKEGFLITLQTENMTAIKKEIQQDLTLKSFRIILNPKDNGTALIVKHEMSISTQSDLALSIIATKKIIQSLTKEDISKRLMEN